MKATIHLEVNDFPQLITVLNAIHGLEVKCDVFEIVVPSKATDTDEVKVTREEPVPPKNSEPVKRRKEDPEKKPYTLICRGCGVEFKSKFATAIVCSQPCYYKYKKSLKGKEIAIQPEPMESIDLSDQRDKVECRVCGNEFRPKTSRSEYCSPKCSRVGKIMLKIGKS